MSLAKNEMLFIQLSDLRLAISISPVPWAEYASFARENGRPILRYPVRATDPVTGVSAADATAFARWLSQREGRSYRLPRLNEMLALAWQAQEMLRIWPCQTRKQWGILPDGPRCPFEWLDCTQTGKDNVLHCVAHPVWLLKTGGPAARGALADGQYPFVTFRLVQELDR
jgi:hypothetical protein